MDAATQITYKQTQNTDDVKPVTNACQLVMKMLETRGHRRGVFSFT